MSFYVQLIVALVTVDFVRSDLFSIRLADGSTDYEGRLEIYYNGEWGTVCDDGWGDDEAQVVCQQLGYGQPVQALISSTYIGSSYQSILLDDVDCTGSESSLSSCLYSIGSHNCVHSEDVALECSPSWYTSSPVVYLSIRLAGGSSSHRGRLEVYYDGEWGTVCDDAWDEYDARVACRQLGFGVPVESLIDSEYDGDVYQSILLDEVECHGSESTIASCSHAPFGVHNCAHSEDVALECSLGFSVRLNNDVSVTSNIGRLEIYYDGEWGTVCDDSWTEANARVVCRQLGYGEPVQTLINAYEGYGQTILLDEVVCSGSESILSMCSYPAIGSHDCTHSEDVAMECSLGSYSDLSVRLIDGPTEFEGRLEVYYGGEWGTVCDDNWDENNARVACRQLDYGVPAQTLISHLYLGDVTQNIILDDVDCDGSESTLTSCSYSPIGVNNCGHYEDVALECSSVRLADGFNENVGRLEILYNGEWMQVCNNYWTDSNSEVACRELGYSRVATLTEYIPYSYGSFRYTFTCYGSESSLLDCIYNSEEDLYCYDAVQLQCVNGYDFEGDVRLSGGYDQGILEAYIYGIWGTVCSHNWNKEESDVVCRQLGYDSSKEVDDSSYYETTYQAIHTLTIDCSGEEWHLNDCYYNTAEVAYGCTHDDDVAITCVYDGLSIGAIIGIVVGVIVVMVVVLCVVLCYCCNKKPPQPTNRVGTHSHPPPNPPATNISLHVQQNHAYPPNPGYPLSPPAWPPANLPPSYVNVVNSPHQFTHQVGTTPTHVPYQPPVYPGTGQGLGDGREIYSSNYIGGNTLYGPPISQT